MWISKEKWDALGRRVKYLEDDYVAERNCRVLEDRISLHHKAHSQALSALRARLDEAMADVAKLKARVAELEAQLEFREHTITFRRAPLLFHKDWVKDSAGGAVSSADFAPPSVDEQKIPVKRVLARIMEHLGLRLQFTPQSADVVKIEPQKKERRRG